MWKEWAGLGRNWLVAGILTGLVFTVLAVAGCGQTTTGSLIRAAVAEKGREVAAEGLVNAEWFLCRAAPIGAVKDRYGKPGLADAYAALCGSAADEVVRPVEQAAE